MAGENFTSLLEIDPVKAGQFVEDAQRVSDLCGRIAKKTVYWLDLDYQEFQKVWTCPQKGRVAARL